MEGQTVVRERHQLVVIGVTVGEDVVAAVFFQECAASLPCGSISCL
jgi:hypothetical protein